MSVGAATPLVVQVRLAMLLTMRDAVAEIASSAQAWHGNEDKPKRARKEALPHVRGVPHRPLLERIREPTFGERVAAARAKGGVVKERWQGERDDADTVSDMGD